MYDIDGNSLLKNKVALKCIKIDKKTSANEMSYDASTYYMKNDRVERLYFIRTINH